MAAIKAPIWARAFVEFLADELMTPDAIVRQSPRDVRTLEEAKRLADADVVSAHDQVAAWMPELQSKLEGLDDARWTYFLIKMLDRVIGESVDHALRAALSFAPRAKSDESVKRVLLVLRNLEQRLLRTDALINRNRVKHSVTMLTRHLGAEAGSWVGDSVIGRRPLSETLAHVSLVLALDIWRSWTLSLLTETKSLENAQNAWHLLLTNAARCRLAADLARKAAANAEKNHSAGLSKGMADSFRGGAVEDELYAIIPKYYIVFEGALSDETIDGFDFAYTMEGVYRLPFELSCIEELQLVWLTKNFKRFAVPKWKPKFGEKVLWTTLGDDLWREEFGHLFK